MSRYAQKLVAPLTPLQRTRVESAAANTVWTAETCANVMKLPIEQVREVYAIVRGRK